LSCCCCCHLQSRPRRSLAVRTHLGLTVEPLAVWLGTSTGGSSDHPPPNTPLERQHPCPSTGRTSGRCPGYVVDHVRPLECGGADAPSNMQWQTIAEGKAKDKTERLCR
jgi:hypothetical protein